MNGGRSDQDKFRDGEGAAPAPPPGRTGGPSRTHPVAFFIGALPRADDGGRPAPFASAKWRGSGTHRGDRGASHVPRRVRAEPERSSSASGALPGRGPSAATGIPQGQKNHNVHKRTGNASWPLTHTYTPAPESSQFCHFHANSRANVDGLKQMVTGGGMPNTFLANPAGNVAVPINKWRPIWRAKVIYLSPSGR